MRQGVEDAFADVGGPADAVEEFGLEETRYSQGGRGECDAEGGKGSDEKILQSALASVGECHTYRMQAYVLVDTG